MIKLTQLNGKQFMLNDDLIEIIENIPETKITLTTGKYYLVAEDLDAITQMIINYKRGIYKGMINIVPNA
ncbi:MAG TPA: endoflagellar protein [Ruminococcaceae bacterium]|jgi:flagellar protein FlbD|nr:endoflagellar protein [Oscillospiraceae bacterium]